MRTIAGFIITALALCLPVTVSAEDLTITTYYPSPFGSYDQLTTANDTFLATTGGFVGIGTITPTEKLDVTGNIRATGTITGDVVTANSVLNGPGVMKQIQNVCPVDNVWTDSATWVDIPNTSITLTTGNSILLIFWNMGVVSWTDGTTYQLGTIAYVRALVDGAQVGTYYGGAYEIVDSDNDGMSDLPQLLVSDVMSGTHMALVNAGTHTVKLQWRVYSPGRIYSFPNNTNPLPSNQFESGRSLTVLEFSR